MPKLFRGKKQKAADPLPEHETVQESEKALEEYESSFTIQLRVFEYLQPEEKQ